MNLEFLNPFTTAEFPEVIERAIANGFALVCQFDDSGKLIACGCNDGRVVIWDFMTRCEIVILIGHVRAVTALSWSRDSKYLLSSGLDWCLYLWEVQKGSPIQVVQFESSLMSCSLDPFNSFRAVVCPLMEPPVLIDLKTLKQKYIPSEVIFDENYAEDSNVDNTATLGNESGQEHKGLITSVRTQGFPSNTFATFDKNSSWIYLGNKHGYIITFDPDEPNEHQTIKGTNENAHSNKIKTSNSHNNGSKGELAKPNETGELSEAITAKAALRVKGNSAVKGIEWSSDGRYFVVNSCDRILRVYDSLSNKSHSLMKNTQPISECYNIVSKEQWRRGRFSANGDYIIAGSMAERAEHKLYIFDRSGGSLAKILEGPPEGILDLTWHPHRPIVVSCSASGMTYIWAQQFNENWSAFAPEFQELEENIPYIEKEDEFDFEENDGNNQALIEEDTNTKIDIITKKAFIVDSDLNYRMLTFDIDPHPDPLPIDLNSFVDSKNKRKRR